jgi:hypothetical protein
MAPVLCDEVIAVMRAMMLLLLLDLWVVSAMAMTMSTSRRSATVAACCVGAKDWCFGVGKKRRLSYIRLGCLKFP